MRNGYTTGSCAAAAAKAALLAMGGAAPETVSITLPRGDELEIPVKECRTSGSRARCVVVKDGGDDPDVTHGADIAVEVELMPPGPVLIEGGEGVGTVTKPGLGLEIGGPAINPVPKKMILENAAPLLGGRGARVTVSVPKGKELAPKTDNPRLGILGGISILGTSGIVVPFSTASFAAAIRQSVSVASSAGASDIVLTTGGRSEEFASEIFDLPDHCYIQMGDFAGYAVGQCAKKGLRRVHVAGFVGKMAKMAAGVKQTHVKGSKVDMGMLAEIARGCGAQAAADRIEKANTARHALEIAQEEGADGFCQELCGRAKSAMSADGVELEVILFGFDGTILARA